MRRGGCHQSRHNPILSVFAKTADVDLKDTGDTGVKGCGVFYPIAVGVHRNAFERGAGDASVLSGNDPVFQLESLDQLSVASKGE